MNTTLSQGAEADKSFQYYVKFLADKGSVQPNATPCVNHLRNQGNDATYEIRPVSEKKTEDLFNFIKNIIKVVFQYTKRSPNDS